MEIMEEDRKEMNDIVDFIIQNIYSDVDFGKAEKVKREMGITNPYDFIMGMIYTEILSSISINFRSKIQMKKVANNEQFTETMTTIASQVMSERMPELRKAVNQHL